MDSLAHFIPRFQLIRPEEAEITGQRDRHAAVLLPITDKPRPGILLTLRAASLRSHPGQISLPGGAADPGDTTPVATALREAQEEIAIPPQSVQVLGQMAPVDSVTGFRVTPVVGIIPPSLALRGNPQEVADIFELPLDAALDVSRYRYIDMKRNTVERRLYFYLYEGRMIWGLTAGILYRLATQVKND